MSLPPNDRPIALCSHLASQPEPDEYHVWFTGRGMERHWVCPDCARQYPDLTTELVTATDELVEHCHVGWHLRPSGNQAA